jgi:methyltransferase (TIGR00027 family)
MARDRPSRTALKIARFMVLLDADPRLRSVLPPNTASMAEAILRASGALPAWQVDMMRARWAHGLYRGIEALTGRGQLLWFGLRKRWISERADVALSCGARQLLVFGGGFDPLATRIAASDEALLVVETDEAATAQAKRRGLEAAGFRLPNHQVLDAAVKERPLADVLDTTSWRHDVETVVVAEGLLMYLTPVEIESFFLDLNRCVPTGSTVLCTSVYARKDGSPRVDGALARPIRFALRLAGEPMHTGLEPRNAPAFFERHGASVREQPTTEDLQAEFLVPMGLRDERVTAYEHLIAAELVAVGRARGEAPSASA